MKKAITIENEGLHYLHQILSTSPVRSTAESRKQSVAFAAIRPHLEQYRTEMKDADEKFRVYEKVKGENGVEKEGYRIPREKKADHEKAIRDVDLKKIEVEFEVESFTLLKSAFDGFFERKEVKEQGIAGEDQVRFLDQISQAFEKAKQI